jgi:hypothetical protein
VEGQLGDEVQKKWRCRRMKYPFSGAFHVTVCSCSSHSSIVRDNGARTMDSLKNSALSSWDLSALPAAVRKREHARSVKSPAHPGDSPAL